MEGLHTGLYLRRITRAAQAYAKGVFWAGGLIPFIMQKINNFSIKSIKKDDKKCVSFLLFLDASGSGAQGVVAPSSIKQLGELLLRVQAVGDEAYPAAGVQPGLGLCCWCGRAGHGRVLHPFDAISARLRLRSGGPA